MLRKILNRLRKIFVYKIQKPIYIPVNEGGKLLENKTVFITGGTKGIGYAIAALCAKNGANVIITSRTIESLNNTIVKLKKESTNNSIVTGIVLELSKYDDLTTRISEFLRDKKIDILVNNAGEGRCREFCKTEQEDYERILSTNLEGTYFLSQSFANYFIQNQIHGHILNISSVSGFRPAISPYMVSKWGITGLTKGMAKKLIKYGIVVNGIAPGPTATEMLGRDGTDLTYSKSPSGRLVDVHEIANLALFLISDMGNMIVGETICISGGCGTLTYDDIYY